MAADNRKQLVGLRTKERKQVIPEGAHGSRPNQPMPMDMLGQVTSSYYSPNVGSLVAMAAPKAGR